MGIQGAAVASKLACMGFEILDIWILCGIREIYGDCMQMELLATNIFWVFCLYTTLTSRLALAHQWLELEKDWAANWTP
ncbi:hypothetical protein QL285_014994 [Trifolium repens]|nr:hypothetical protein QL285_014994 [Trifolium repens]